MNRSVRWEGIARLPPGAEALEVALAVLAQRTARGDLAAVVVASVTGATALRVCDALGPGAPRLICVADTPEWTGYGHPYPMLPPTRYAQLRARGVEVLRDYRSTSAGMPRFDPQTGRDVAASPAEAALFWAGLAAVGGEGLKTAVKSVILATDYGLLHPGERVASLGGAGGREAVAVLDAIPHAHLLSGAPGTRLCIREILCLPAPTP
ncbi:MAG: hypothetical protein QHJ73_01265 [Armatimonadota bacterium]|nr:hypothetical protein [Armatimonadota bacterium]